MFKMVSWKCHICNLYNDILRNRCWNCLVDKPEHLTELHQLRIEIQRDIFYRRLEHECMTKDEELFAKYYQVGAILVKDMKDDQLLTRREELKKIVLEARAHLSSTDEEIKTRRKKLSGKTQDWLSSVETDQVTSDAIAAVSVRKDRMSKLDKMRETLLANGMDEEIVNEMMSNMSKAQDKAILIPAAKKKDIIEITTENKKPFDPTSLKF